MYYWYQIKVKKWTKQNEVKTDKTDKTDNKKILNSISKKKNNEKLFYQKLVVSLRILVGALTFWAYHTDRQFFEDTDCPLFQISSCTFLVHVVVLRYQLIFLFEFFTFSGSCFEVNSSTLRLTAHTKSKAIKLWLLLNFSEVVVFNYRSKKLLKESLFYSVASIYNWVIIELD